MAACNWSRSLCLSAPSVPLSASQFEAWRHTDLIIDVVPGRGGMFSLDNGRERRFLARARVFSEDEIAALEATKP